MTISNTIRTAGPYIGNGVTTTFPFYFKIFKAADLLAVQTDVATGVATSLVLNSGYTVTLNSDQNASPGGTATLPAALATGKTLVMTSALDYLQPLDITNGGGFYPAVLNAALDRLTIFCQQLFGLASRSLKLPLSDTGMNTELPSAAARAGRILSFDFIGNPVVVAPSSGSAADLALILSGSNGANGVGIGSTTVGAFLGNVHGIDVTIYGASPSATSSVNTAVLNAVNLLAISTGRPVYFPPIGTYKIGRLAAVVGSLTWYSSGSSGASVQVDGTAWPYDVSNVAVLDITGSFRTHGLTWDQNWILPTHAPVAGAYNDSNNPRTWGGFWFVRVLCSTTDVVKIQHCHFKTVARGFFAQAANTALGGAASVVMTDCSGDSLLTNAQSLLAAEAPQSFQVADCWSIVTEQWNNPVAYKSNGTSVVFPWGGSDIQIVDNRFVGYQLVCRGPSSNLWAASSAYAAGLEYLAPSGESRRVESAYTSGPVYGATDLANTVTVFNPQEKIQVCRNHIISPIADTAIYGWRDAVIDENLISDSGDMGIAASGTAFLSVSNNIIKRVRNGGIDVTYGGVANVVGNVVVDYARASAGVYQRIDTLNPNVWASNGGFNLAGITVGLTQEPGTKQINIVGNNLYFISLPPVTDGGPNNGGVVRASVNGIFSQLSSNINAQNTINAHGNTLQDNESSMPQFYLAVATYRFNCSAISGTPVPGQVFSSGAVKFVLVNIFGAGGFVFVRQFQGAAQPFGSQVFTGQNGATITVATTPQFSGLTSDESGNIDLTSKYINALSQEVFRGQALIDPASIAVGGVLPISITVNGAAVGDYADVAPPYQIQGLEMTYYVANTNQVQVILRNGQGAAIDLGSGVWKAKVSKG